MHEPFSLQLDLQSKHFSFLLVPLVIHTLEVCANVLLLTYSVCYL